MANNEDKTINMIELQGLLSILTEKELETIILWSNGMTMKDIAAEIGTKYDQRTEANPLGGRAMGARVRKIIEKLRKHAFKKDLLLETSGKQTKRRIK